MIDLQRLRDRKLVQWAVAYLAAAWLILQLLDVLADTFAWPQLVARIGTVLLAVGVLAALVIAWYHGEKGSQHVGGVELVMLAGILVLAGAAVGYFARAAGRSPPPAGADVALAVGAAAEQGSIAVLPFVNLSGDPNEEYFSDGLTEELLNVLSQLPELRVAARTSAFAFKGREVGVDSIARALRVAHLVEGSVRKSGNEVRITAQLIDGRTGYHLWSGTFDREYGDIFAIQDEISHRIVGALQLRLASKQPATGVTYARVETSDPEAHTLLLRGMAALQLQTNAGFRQAHTAFEAALARDPGYLQARAQLAFSLTTLAYTGLMPREETYRQARLEAEHVLAADSGHVIAQRVLGRIAEWHDWDWAGAMAHYERALASNPSDAASHASLSWLLMRTGEPERALAEARRALELDPLSPGAFNNLGSIYYYSSQYQAAAEQYRNAVTLSPDATLMWANLAYAQVLAGDLAAAAETAEHARSLEPTDTYVNSTLAYVYGRAGRQVEAQSALSTLESLPAAQWSERATANLGLGRTDVAIEQLEKAVAAGEDYMADLGMDPVFASLHGDPRFQRLLAQVGVR